DQYQTVTTPKPPIPITLPPPCECEMLISRSRPTSVAKAAALAKSDSQLSERLTKCLNATCIVHLRIAQKRDRHPSGVRPRLGRAHLSTKKFGHGRRPRRSAPRVIGPSATRQMPGTRHARSGDEGGVASPAT